MMNTKRNRGRMNSRPDKRQNIYPDRPPRSRGPPVDKNAYIEGVYKNQRYINVVVSLVGTIVQAQVKNGLVYEGVLKTVSHKGDAVLEMAHMVEDNTGSSGCSTPSRERIMDKLIIKVADLVTINAANVDLEYAVKDAFTDTGISKYNGEMKDNKEMRELQPWDAEGADEIGILEGDKSNGWDVHEMFQTNARVYNIKSTYDESLGQYTTKLNKENSEEYRRREEEATRLAAEIERSEQYKKHIALENGEGDNEEEAFSSVVRPQESQGGQGKYIPPNKRNPGAGGMGKPGNRGYPHQQNPPPPQQQHHHHQQPPPPVGNRNISSHRQSPPVTQTSNSQSSVETVNVNGEKSNRSSIPVSTAGPTIKTSSPVHEGGGPGGEVSQRQQYPTTNKDNKKSMKGRDEQIQELKEFSSNFKLDDNKETKEKDKDKPSGMEGKDPASPRDTAMEDKEKEYVAEKVSEAASSPDKMVSGGEEKIPETESLQEKPGEAESKPKDIPIKSNLNPNAIVFTPKSFPQKQTTQQIPTPPRPQTQSPIIQPAPMIAQPVYPAPGQSYMIQPNTAMVPTAQPQQLPYVRPKRAVVSVKPDYTASAVQAATGQPLLAQSQQYMYIHHPQMIPPQPTGYQMGQVSQQQMMPMPPAQTTPRFMTPTSMQGMPPTTMQGAGLEQNTPSGGQGGQMYMAPHQQGPMPAHINHASHLNHPNHMNHLNMSSNTQQNTQMNPPPPSGAGPHHPAPSPVLTNHNQQPMNSGPHPPSSGTPQPPQGYPQATLQAPPLQPSPHNPTSPQNMQQMPYPYTSHPLQMQSSAGGGQQFSLPQQSTGQSSVTYSMHSHQSPHMQPQLVMMPPQMSASGQLNHPHHMHSSHQFQGHPMAGPGSIQQQLMTQSGVQGLHSQNPGQGPHPQHQMQHFLPQGLTAAAALTNALHARQDHFIVQHLRK